MTIDSLLGVQASRITASAEKEKAPALRGYRSVNGITLECGDAVFTDIGWVFFEATTSSQIEVRGIISTYNDYATYTLVRLGRGGCSCHLEGLFNDDKTGEHRVTLDNLVIENMLVQDMTAIAGFRAVVPNSLPV